MRISLWHEGKRTSDFNFFDKTIREMFTLGGTGVNVHKYLGPASNAITATVTTGQIVPGLVVTVNSVTNIVVGQYVTGIGIATNTKVGAITGLDITLTQLPGQAIDVNTQLFFSATQDATQPVYPTVDPTNIQDVLLQENRDRKYDPDIFDLRCIYNVSDLDFDLSQFGLFLQNDVVFITFHLNTMVQRLGRKLMNGDVLELPHLKDFYSLDENISIALKRFYVVTDATRSAEGFSPTWWPHLWRVKCKPLVNSQEYTDILKSIDNGDGTNTLADIMSDAKKRLAINDAIIAEAEKQVPTSGFNTDPFWITPQATTDKNSAPLDPTSAPNVIMGGYLVGDGIPPNGLPVTSGLQFPSNPAEGTYYLRLDFKPNTLFVYKNGRWVRVEDNVRTSLTPGNGETQRDQFINDSDTFVNQQGVTEKSKRGLTTILGPENDYLG